MKEHLQTDAKAALIKEIERVHTTALGVERIQRNLALINEDVVAWCKRAIMEKGSTCLKKGKNYYVQYQNCCITIHALSYTIITAHRHDQSKKSC